MKATFRVNEATGEASYVLKLRVTRERLATWQAHRDSYNAAVSSPGAGIDVAEICRRAWRRTSRLLAAGQGVGFAAFLESATRANSTVIEVAIPASDRDLLGLVLTRPHAELCAMVACRLAELEHTTRKIREAIR